MLYNTAISNQR